MYILCIRADTRVDQNEKKKTKQKMSTILYNSIVCVLNVCSSKVAMSPNLLPNHLPFNVKTN